MHIRTNGDPGWWTTKPSDLRPGQTSARPVHCIARKQDAFLPLISVADEKRSEYIIRKYANGRARAPASGELSDLYCTYCGYPDGALSKAESADGGC